MLLFLGLFFIPLGASAQMACDWTYQPVCAVSRTQDQGDQIREILWTYHNSCVAQARRARIISDGVCPQPSRMVPRTTSQAQPEQTTTEQGVTPQPSTQAPVVREPAKPFADYLQSADPTLTTMRRSIVTRMEDKSLTEKVTFLTSFLDTLNKQLSATDSSSPTYTQLTSIRTSIQTWLDDAQGSTTRTPSTSQPSQAQSSIQPTQDQTTQRWPVSVSSNGWIRTPKGDILLGTKNGETITITFAASSAPSTPKPTRSGQTIASWSSFDALIAGHIRDTICEPRPNTVRTIGYQALWQDAWAFANQQDRVVIVMCRHRPSPKTATSEPLSLIIRPMRLSTIETSTTTTLTDLRIAPIDGTYSDFITTQFPAAVHNVLTGKDPTRYQRVIQTLTQVNRAM